ncbi:MAG TPA: flagellar hook assembly protein FlgD [Steroidobacteraceae bacterium]|jgi:flagellar basal-body rod modification protein FlgD|nr:flagellar hook assembly protein FlgD [Steroidobacteraceae bacterium]
MSIADVINGTGAAGSSSQTSGTKKKDQLGQNEFLQLMLAQLKNQDPFKAMDPSQFLGQLAQFGTVTGIQDMQAAFTSMSDAMRSSQVLDGASMVGRDVLVPSDTVTLHADGSVKGSIDVPKGLTGLTVNIRDGAGALVRRMTLPTDSGNQEFTWDGLRDDGTRAAAGDYDIEAIGSLDGQSGSLEMLFSSRVNSVTIDSSGLILNTNDLGARPLSDVRRVM